MAVSRRRFLQLVGAAAGAGASACSGRAPRSGGSVAGAEPAEGGAWGALTYATSSVLDGHATGLLVHVRGGRPIRIDGNPDHPASLGAAGVLEQASVLSLYDPDRATSARLGGAPCGPDALRRLLAARADGGERLRFLIEPTSSPLLDHLLGRIAERYPRARVAVHAALGLEQTLEGARLAHGRRLQPQRDLRRAAAILAVDADLVGAMPFALAAARQLAARGRPGGPGPARLHVVEPTPTATGDLADRRLARRAADGAALLGAIVAELAALGRRPPALPGAAAALLERLRPHPDAAFVRAVARDLAAHAPEALVVAGERQPPEAHALAHLANAALAGVADGRGGAAWLIAPTLLEPSGGALDLPGLAAELAAGAVDTLVILEGNPVYTAPAGLELGRLLRERVGATLYLGAYEDETAAACGAFVPASHALERWGDALAYDGTPSFLQPAVVPLEDGRTPAEILASFLAGSLVPAGDGRAWLGRAWQERARLAPGALEPFLEDALRRGCLAGAAAPPVEAGLAWDSILPALERVAAAGAAASTPGLELAFRPSPAVHDGRFANNRWLQELPDPHTKLTWGTALHVSPATAAAIGARDGERVSVALGGRALALPLLAVPGHADGSATLTLGYGRQGAERVARDAAGARAFDLRAAAAPWFAAGAEVTRLGGRAALARTQRRLDLAGPTPGPGPAAAPPSLHPPSPAVGEGWGMVIDLSRCTGCGACVIACQAENNVPTVGRDGVARGRELHWIRIDTHVVGVGEAARHVHRPTLCQHCERAPCESACPVGATVHGPDGLNEMVYNRCLGSRFCMSACPVRARRFNYADRVDRTRTRLQRNPDVTARGRGVVEKCTFCVQRIRAGELAARRRGRPLVDGEVVTACQAACPTGAIVFGALADPTSELARARRDPRAGELLPERGDRSRVWYLARVRRPDPEVG